MSKLASSAATLLGGEVVRGALRSLLPLVCAQARLGGWRDALRVLWCALCLLPHRAFRHSLRHQSVLAADLARDDPLFHLHHRHFLWQGMNMGARLRCLAHHVRTEERAGSPRYLAEVYGGQGLVLWTHEHNQMLCQMVLRSVPKSRHEGLLSVELEVDGEVLHVMSLAWVPGAELQLAPTGTTTVALLTRNQSLRPRGETMATYRKVYPQVAAHYLCLAAVHGIVRWHGQSQLAAVPHERQIAYCRSHHEGFVHSYSGLWESLGGQRRGRAYLMPLALPWPALDEVSAKHRGRARARRAAVASVQAATEQALATCRRSAA